MGEMGGMREPLSRGENERLEIKTVKERPSRAPRSRIGSSEQHQRLLSSVVHYSSIIRRPLLDWSAT
jgi:hypothetical protein